MVPSGDGFVELLLWNRAQNENLPDGDHYDQEWNVIGTAYVVAKHVIFRKQSTLMLSLWNTNCIIAEGKEFQI